VLYTDIGHCGGYGTIEILMKNGNTETIDFDGIEGGLYL
jgi:hypothetical protein